MQKPRRSNSFKTNLPNQFKSFFNQNLNNYYQKMVESNDADSAGPSHADLNEPLELHHFHEWNDFTEEEPECDEEKATENCEIVESELESLPAFLTEQEY